MLRRTAGALAVAILVAGCSTVGASPAASDSPGQSNVPPTTASADSTPRPASPASPSSAPAASSLSPSASETLSGHWVPAGSLVLGRLKTYAVPLLDGRVLVVGADNTCAPGGAFDDSVQTELWLPNSNGWKPMPDLGRPRDSFAIARLPDGRVLVSGGLNGGGRFQAYSSTVLFDPRNGTWSAGPLLGTARAAPASAVLSDGRVLVTGGYYADGRETMAVLRSTEIYDPAAGRWAPTGSLAEPRYDAQAVALSDGRVLVVGGWPAADAGGPAPLYGLPLALASAEIFDPLSGRWSPAGSLMVARVGFTLTALPNGAALVTGGTRAKTEGEAEYLATAERFDPGLGTWTAAGSMRVAATAQAAAALPDGRVLVAGGYGASGPSIMCCGTGVANVEIYNPAQGTWKAAAPLPDARGGATMAVLADGSIVLLGGVSAASAPVPSGAWDMAPCCPPAERATLRYIPG
jgi:hypothetical protein